MKVTVLIESRLGGLAALMLKAKRVLYFTTKSMFWNGFKTPEETINISGCNWQMLPLLCASVQPQSLHFPLLWS